MTSTPEQDAARVKWVDEVCKVMAERFKLGSDSNGMTMVRMMAEVASYGMFCACGEFTGAVCCACVKK